MIKKRLQLWFLRLLPLWIMLIKFAVTGTTANDTAQPEPEWSG